MNSCTCFLLYTALSAIALGQSVPSSANPAGAAQQPHPASSGTAASSSSTQGTPLAATDPPATKADVADAIKTQLEAADKHPDFELSLGIGSLVDGPGTSDYTNQSNILQATNLGRATPQYLVGVSLRTPYPNFGPFGHSKTDCVNPKPAQAPSPTVNAKGKLIRLPYYTGDTHCDYWKQNPWKAFVNLKFASGSSQTLNGFVLGGSYQFGHYVDALVGFGFTPFNEPSPGLRIAASQFVTAQQKLGNYLNFDPNAMLLGQKNAFDGFSLTDSTGKLIYSGNPLEVHFRGGVVLGVAIPVSFSSVFSGKAQ